MSNKNVVCHECGAVQMSTKGRVPTWAKVLLSALTLIVIATAAFLLFGGGGSENGYFRNTKWGMSQKEVAKIERNAISIPIDKEDRLAFITDDNFAVPGQKCQVSYIFENDSLVEAMLIILYDDMGKNGALKILDAYQFAFGGYESPRPNVDGRSRLGGVWRTRNSYIEAIKVYEGAVVVTYSDITRPYLYEE